MNLEKHVLSLIRASLVASILMLGACASTYTSTYVSTSIAGIDEANTHLQNSRAVLVTTPKDGNYEQKLYSGPGAVVAQKLEASFSRYASHVSVYPSEYHSIKGISDTVANGNYGYLVVPTIIRWEHRATAWSGLPSRATIRISILDAKNGKEISAIVVEGKSA